MQVITIDGPAAAGKGTIGRCVAQRLKCFYLDSGLIYRQMASWVLDLGVDTHEIKEVLPIVTANVDKFRWEDINEAVLRSERVSIGASRIGVFPEIRRISNKLQHECVSNISGWSVIDGRDAGTNVFPEADIKLFITARADVRAKRRYSQLRERGEVPDLKQLEIEIIQRDLRDQNRDVAPLKPAADAYIIDTSDELVDESLLRALKYLEKYAVA